MLLEVIGVNQEESGEAAVAFSNRESRAHPLRKVRGEGWATRRGEGWATRLVY